MLAGRFRQDLYYRLDVIEIQVAPLRERREDLPALCQALLRRIAAEAGIPVPTLSTAGLEKLCQNPLPGNVRELENLLQRAVALRDGEELQLELAISHPATLETSFPDSSPAPLDEDQSTIPSDLQGHLDNQERDILIQALRETGFNRTAAAARLGLSLRQIRYRIARLHIETPQSGELSDEAL